MICPYCHIEYTPSSPCFCQPRAKNTAPAQTAGETSAKEEKHSPAGLDNPFWHC